MLQKKIKSDSRSIGQIQEHYEIEKQLAAQLRQASDRERTYLYTQLYDELYKSVPHHPQLVQKEDARSKQVKIEQQLQILHPWLTPNSTFLEIGPGDCSLSFAIADRVEKVYAVDVSTEITRHLNFPKNFELIVSDGCQVPVPEASVDLAYSNQLMEHLHPDDALRQLQQIYAALKQGGRYLCITPNRLNGPHDISYYFDEVATGFHLKEYTFTELSELFRQVGFDRVFAYVGARGIYLATPIFLLKWCEFALNLLPSKLRSGLASTLLFSAILNIRILAQK